MTHQISATEKLADRGFQLERDAFGRLNLTDADGKCWEGVEPARPFPLSSPENWLSIYGTDGREILLIRNPESLSADIRALLEEELACREFVPVITKIYEVNADVDPSEWEVETDRGPARFLVENEDDIRRMGDHQAILTDNHGVRYLVPDMRKMDHASRRILARFF